MLNFHRCPYRERKKGLNCRNRKSIGLGIKVSVRGQAFASIFVEWAGLYGLPKFRWEVWKPGGLEVYGRIH